MYSSSLTDDEWLIIEPLLPKKKLTCPLTWTKREILDGVFYQLKNGCNWGDLPKDFPTYSYFNSATPDFLLLASTHLVFWSFQQWIFQTLFWGTSFNTLEVGVQVFLLILDLFLALFFSLNLLSPFSITLSALFSKPYLQQPAVKASKILAIDWKRAAGVITILLKKNGLILKKRSFCLKSNLGIELLSHEATPRVSSPQLRLTVEFGMESKWNQSAKDTKKWFLKWTIKTA